jgi:uncharacterized lipoprotein YmbA
MSKLHSHRTPVIVLFFFSMVLGGCFGSSQPSRFYTLSSLPGPEPVSRATPTGQPAIVAFGPLAIPDYLDRPEIVTRTGQNEVRVNEFQRWGGSLDGNLSRIIVEDLSVLLQAEHYSVIREAAAAQTRVPIRYRVMVDVKRFDAAPGGMVVLEANWSVYGMEKEMPLMRNSIISAKVSGTEFTDLVAAMSKAVEDLCREIAAAVTGLDQKAQGT